MTFGDLGPHAGFILAAYAIFGAVVLGLIAWIVRDGAAQRRALADLEARGIRRRSDGDPIAATDSHKPAGPESSGSAA
jgi:heme exporter protein D